MRYFHLNSTEIQEPGGGNSGVLPRSLIYASMDTVRTFRPLFFFTFLTVQFMRTVTDSKTTLANTPTPIKQKPTIAKTNFDGSGMPPEVWAKLRTCMGLMLVDRPPKFWKETIFQMLECWVASDLLESTDAKDRRAIMANMSLLAITFTNDF